MLIKEGFPTSKLLYINSSCTTYADCLGQENLSLAILVLLGLRLLQQTNRIGDLSPACIIYAMLFVFYFGKVICSGNLSKAIHYVQQRYRSHV